MCVCIQLPVEEQLDNALKNLKSTAYAMDYLKHEVKRSQNQSTWLEKELTRACNEVVQLEKQVSDLKRVAVQSGESHMASHDSQLEMECLRRDLAKAQETINQVKVSCCSRGTCTCTLKCLFYYKIYMQVSM